MVFVQALLFVGFLYLLFKASEIVVSKAMEINKVLKLGEFVVGFLFLAFVSNLPDISIGIYSVQARHVEIGISDIFGSVVTDILLATGIVFLITKYKFVAKDVRILTKILFATSIIPLLFFLNISNYAISFLLFVTFLYFARTSFQRKITVLPKRTPAIRKLPKSFFKNVAILAAATFVVVVSAKIVTTNALEIIEIVGFSKAFMGGVAIAIGTSLPEISFAIKIKNKPRVALATVMGASLTNLTFVLGLLMIFAKNVVAAELSSLILFCIFAAGVIYFLLETKSFGKKYGAMLLFLYLAYTYIIFSG